MANLTMIQAINEALRISLEQDPRTIILGEDVGHNGGVFRATEGLQAKFGENRVVDTPLAESAIIGTSIGLALNGMKPIAEIQFLGFIFETMDQIASQAARTRFRSQGRFHVPLVIRTPFGGGVRTPEMHADSLEALFLHTPGLKVVMPSNAYDAKGLLLSALADPDPVLFLEPMRLYRLYRHEVPAEPYQIPLGKANVVREGTHITIVTWGPMVPVTMDAVKQLQDKHNISCEVIDLRTISPIDTETIIQSVEKTNRALVVHEAVKTGGVGAEIIARINERALYSLEAPVKRVTGFDTPYPMSMVEDHWLPNSEHIINAVLETINE
ncbi:alpha-ketoacid dehydrogenase subunit beta [Ammoniphilus resinae]|uniref:Pyruvate dehydrogenase E1 component beta subunit n=1 Tax=Ammoniphilus resinae TaxID=861532 RepID=A0ABS4GUV7_9BACL|nr:alpha-ketoacid dehydrogenase subunit beta [Ammoniphilus resinae]MBP1933847.1 pyruvate dehydrogenase E1 component beta subunit [Ammoniphilus resinae]